jgi:hypothetical protein
LSPLLQSCLFPFSGYGNVSPHSTNSSLISHR